MKKLVSISAAIIIGVVAIGSFLRPAKADQHRSSAIVIINSEESYTPYYHFIVWSVSSGSLPRLNKGTDLAEALEYYESLGVTFVPTGEWSFYGRAQR